MQSYGKNRFKKYLQNRKSPLPLPRNCRNGPFGGGAAKGGGVKGASERREGGEKKFWRIEKSNLSLQSVSPERRSGRTINTFFEVLQCSKEKRREELKVEKSAGANDRGVRSESAGVGG